MGWAWKVWASCGRPVTRGCRAVCLARGPSQIWGMQPDPRRRSRHSRAEKNFLAGGAGQKMDLSLFRRLRPAEVCDAALPGESMGRRRWGEPYGANPDGLLRWMGRCGRLRRVTDSVHWSPAPPAGRTGFPGGSAPPRPGRSGGPPIPPPATAPGQTGAAPPPGGRRAG